MRSGRITEWLAVGAGAMCTGEEHQQGSGTLCMRNDAECLPAERMMYVPVLNTEIGAVRAEEVALADEPLTE